LKGKVINEGVLGNSPHKFVWYNRRPDEFEYLTLGKVVGESRARGRWLFIDLEPGYVLLLGEIGGKLLYHVPGAELPAKYHLWLSFLDSSHLTAMTQMWGAYELYESGMELERQYVKGMRPTPVDAEFTPKYFTSLIDILKVGEKRSVKGLLTQEQIIPGLGNAIAQDILYHAGLHPRHPISELNADQIHRLYQAIVQTVDIVIEKGGRYDEFDLHNQPGGYVRLMDNRAAGNPCPSCGSLIEKIQYLGGACYFCPNCQRYGKQSK
jgi:formamidopyrimidine-DNA glycosylase